ncbi:MAG: DNA repair protein RecN [Pseudomonadota bacterium]|nr:MAG: DNA repair protein RecN [Pseudomonadota bacterium]
MLTHIHIRNFAIVEKLELELSNGLTVLTGETGAGKSVRLDALWLALGDRAESRVIRHNCDRAEISVTFDVHDLESAQAWLQERELDADGECIIRRTVNRGGPSKAYINGQPAPVQSLRELGEMLVDLHGQHEHQSLLRRDTQREMLDDFAEHSAVLTELSDTWRRWRKLQDERERLSRASSERDARLDLLRYQVNELEQLALVEDELGALESEHGRLANANRLLDGAEHVLQMLDENEQVSARGLLGQGSGEIDKLLAADPALSEVAALLNEASINLQEAASALRHYHAGLELDPQRLEWIEQRLGDIHELSRKHRVAPEALPQLLPQIQAELDELEAADLRLEKIDKEISATDSAWRKLAATLSKGRARSARQLSDAVTAAMQELGMEGGHFEIALHALPEGEFSATGAERIEYLVSANPGQPPQPLARVASGGELSRISLAIQVIAVKGTRIPTLIFDEVDVGIGGRVAEIVGRQLRTLASQRQVICVTHLPQVAALGHHHLQVIKRADETNVLTRIQPLSVEQRVDEIARMLGGIEITDQTLSHARELIDRAQA